MIELAIGSVGVLKLRDGWSVIRVCKREAAEVIVSLDGSHRDRDDAERVAAWIRMIDRMEATHG